MDIREIQKPLKERYREDASSALVALHAEASSAASPMDCSVKFGASTITVSAFEGVGGPGGTTTADVMLGALAACAQITSQMVASAMNLPVKSIRVEVDADIDLRGTLGVTPGVPTGFEEITMRIHVDAPDVTTQQMNNFLKKAEMCSVVLQTMIDSPKISVELARNK